MTRISVRALEAVGCPVELQLVPAVAVPLQVPAVVPQLVPVLRLLR